jgi:hypothetical protein
MHQQAPNIAFLGVCERATQLRLGQPALWKYSILGLKQTVLSHIFPIALREFQFAFAVYDPFAFEDARIRVLTPTNEEICHFDIRLEKDDREPDEYVPRAEIGMSAHSAYPVWAPFVPDLSDIDALITRPDQYKIAMCRGGEEVSIGCLVFGYAPAPPLTEERIAAIRSNPLAAKRARALIRCGKCNDELRVYTGLERDADMERDGWAWYKQLPDSYTCRCGKTRMELTILRDNMHALLGQAIASGEERVSFARLYETAALKGICGQFASLLDHDPEEKQIQRFIEDNPIVLQQFAPARIYHQVPILTKHKTDFAILSNKGELILIEIERPDTRLVKKDGGITAGLQHAFDQVRDWLHRLEEYRSATLDCIGLRPEEVVSVRGVVIAGRDTSCRAEHLRKLKWTDFGPVDFYTYDDILRTLVTLIRTVGDL